MRLLMRQPQSLFDLLSKKITPCSDWRSFALGLPPKAIANATNPSSASSPRPPRRNRMSHNKQSP